MKKFKAVIAGTCLFVVLVAAGRTALAANDALETLVEYFNLLSTGNFESAANLWTEAAIERSSRFGIEYTGIPLKIDCASPIVQNLAKMCSHLEPPVKRVTELHGKDFVRLEYSAIVDGELVEHNYYAIFDGDYYWLTYPQDYYSRRWPVIESRYFRIHSHPEVQKYLNPAVLDEADKFVERIADSLDLSKSDVKVLAEKKIEYFYCDSDSTIEKILGVRVKGKLDLPSNDIISTFFPQYGEITRLLINYSLRRLPIATHPLLQEGWVVYYGGRWGTSPWALADLGSFLFRENVVPLDSLLTMAGFESHASSDIAYPVAGLLTAYLLDKMGQEKYRELYLALSGDYSSVRSLSDSTVKQHLLQATGKSTWAKLVEDFGVYASGRSKKTAVILPGGIEDGKPLLERDGLLVLSNKEWLAFEFSAESSQPLEGNLLFGYDQRFADGSTVMFEEQYQGKQPFEGFRFGVRFDRNEVGLYDYAANQVVAKYIWSITPSDLYYDPEHNKISVKLKKSLVGDLLPTEKNYKLIPL
jgi:hypothetical protein